MILKGLKPYILAIALLCLPQANAESPWKFEAGIGARNITPIVFVAGFSYEAVTVRVQGLGVHNGPRDFWCGSRASLLWTFFNDLPFNFDVGIGGGYEYAEAPNKIHQALNDANNGNYLMPYNYKENLDVSLELWTHLYGFYTQICVPAYQFKNYDVPYVLWGAGYTVTF